MNHLTKNVGIYFLVNFASQGAVFLFWIIAAKLLSASQIGLYALVLFVVDFFGAIAIFGLHSAVVRFYVLKKNQSEVFFNALLIIVLANVLSGLLLFSLSKVIIWILPSISFIFKNNFFLFSGLIFFSSLYNLALSQYAAKKDLLWYSIISLAQTIIFFGLSVALLLFGFQILGILYSLIVSFIISSILFLAKEAKNISFKYFSSKTVKSLFDYSYPMMLYVVFGTITMYAGRIFLDNFTNLSSLGIYSFFLIITLQISSVFATFNKAWTPEIFSALEDNKETAIEKVSWMVFFCSFIYLLLFAFFIMLKEIGVLSFFLHPLYIFNIFVLYILLLGPLFIGIYTAAYPLFYFKKDTKIIFFISIFSNIIEIFLTFFLVRLMSENGAAISYVASNVLSMFILLLVFRESMKIPKKIIIFSALLFFIMSFNVYLLLKFSSEPLFILIIAVSAMTTFWYGQLYKNLPHFLKTVF